MPMSSLQTLSLSTLLALASAANAGSPAAPVGPSSARDVLGVRAASGIAAWRAAEESLDPAHRKIDHRLRATVPAGRSPAAILRLQPLEAPPPDRDGRVPVTVRVDSAGARVLAMLRRRGLRIGRVSAGSGLVEGLATPTALRALAAHPLVRRIQPTERGRLRVGIATTEGDAASGAATFRAGGPTGEGVVVGVISDGIDDVAAAQATGDLAEVTVPAGAGCGPGHGDEGTAMLEIVHDLAPNAQLLFSEGISSPLAFIDSVDCLRGAGARVIVDDIGFFGEPYFEDGPVARAVQAATAANVSFHSAAGNEAGEHLEQIYRSSPSTTYHDFLGGPVDNTDDIWIDSFGIITCILQWNDPFGASGNDYDLYLLDEFLNVVDASIGLQNGSGDPIEIVGAYNPASYPQLAKIVIDRYAGAGRRLEMFCLDGLSPQYLTPAGSIIGHPAVADVVAVGAIDVAEPGLDQVEPFSAQGPSQVFFPAAATRPKPDLAGFDGVSISNAGGFPLCPPYCLFFGTSAAAPHSAAAAALLFSKNPFIDAADAHAALTGGAVDIGAPGRDDKAGFGRLDVVAAGARVPAPECLSDAECDDANACTIDACVLGTCRRQPVSCDDGNACNGHEVCSSGACVPGVPLICDDGNVCNGTEVCDPPVGCVSGAPLICDDGNPCTDDTCVPATGCASTVLPDGASCADATLCNGNETCVAGSCTAGSPLDCTDDEPCTQDACDPVRGCVFIAVAGVSSVTCQLDGVETLLAAAGPSDVAASVRRKLERGMAAVRARLVGAVKAHRMGQTRGERRGLRKTRQALQSVVRLVVTAGRHDRMAAALSAAVVERLGHARSAVESLRTAE